MKQTITKSEYFSLIGLESIASNYNKKLEDIKSIIKEILDENDDGYLCDDIAFGARSVDEILKIKKIKVLKK